jgi:hypothetical protein
MNHIILYFTCVLYEYLIIILRYTSGRYEINAEVSYLVVI